MHGAVNARHTVSICHVSPAWYQHSCLFSSLCVSYCNSNVFLQSKCILPASEVFAILSSFSTNVTSQDVLWSNKVIFYRKSCITSADSTFWWEFQKSNLFPLPAAIPDSPARAGKLDEQIKNIIPESQVTPPPQIRLQPFDYEGEVYVGGSKEMVQEEFPGGEDFPEEEGEDNQLSPRGDVFGKPPLPQSHYTDPSSLPPWVVPNLIKQTIVLTTLTHFGSVVRGFQPIPTCLSKSIKPWQIAKNKYSSLHWK